MMYMQEPLIYDSRDINSGEMYREFIDAMNQLIDISESMRIIISKNKNQIFEIFEQIYSNAPETDPLNCYSIAVLLFLIKK